MLRIKKYARVVWLSALVVLVIFAGSCKDKDDGKDECLRNYPVSGLLSHYADDIIIPDYQQFKTTLDQLIADFDKFNATKNQENLDSLRSGFQRAYLQWMVVEPYEFGPAETVFLRNSLNNFPVNESLVRSKLNAANYDFSSPMAYDKGFPALDFLLYGYAPDDTALLDSFTNNMRVPEYFFKVLEDMQTRTETVINNWTTGGYGSQFKNNTGLAAGQSFSQILNSLNENFEILRRKRIGLPSGVLTLNFPNPTEVEGLYSELSLELVKRSLASCRRYYGGDGGEGLDNVLDFIQAKKSGRNLSVLIFEQFDEARASIDLIPETLSESVVDNSEVVVAAYNELSPLVVLMKSDMPSVMCIAITYVDNPSDSD